MLELSYNSHPDPEKIQWMAQNLANLQRQISLGQSRQFNSVISVIKEKTPQQQRSQQVIQSSLNSTVREDPTVVIRQHYQEYLSSHEFSSNHEDKIEQLLEEDSSVGNAVAMFQMLYYFKEALHEDALSQIQIKAFKGLLKAQTEVEQRCYAQLVAECGVQCEDVCQFMAESLVAESIDFQLGFYVLVNQGVMGLAYLIDLAHRDIVNLSSRILDQLSRSEAILMGVLVPTLVQDVMDVNLSRHRDLSLAALNRLAPLLSSSPDILCQLTSLLHDNTIDKKLLLATIRSSGLIGEQTLLDIIASKQLSQTALSLSLSMLSWRVPSHPVLRVKAIEYTLDYCFMRLYQYQGGLEPWDYTEKHCGDTLCVSARDLLGHLDCFLREKGEKMERKGSSRHLSILTQVLDLEQNQKITVSEEVVRTLVGELKNKSVKIREVALLQLGNIGKPEAIIALQHVAKCLTDADSTIRSAACWTISRIVTNPTKKLQFKLTELLRDSYWKVRTSACISLGLALVHPQPSTVQALIKVLQDASIPKQVVCQTLARMGVEELLLDILKGSGRGDFKLREAIISSFAFVSMRSALIGAIVEQLLRYSRDARVETRQMCLLTLGVLRERQQQGSNPFQNKQLLPFYYCFLDDSSSKIRALAAKNILSFGAQAELLFIEGLTKGTSQTKIECLRCLGKLGVQNFRAVVLGLRDPDERVRRVAGEVIVDCYEVREVLREFGGGSYSMGLVCNLREVLSGCQRSELGCFIGEVLEGLEGSCKGQEASFSRGLWDQNSRLN